MHHALESLYTHSHTEQRMDLHFVRLALINVHHALELLYMHSSTRQINFWHSVHRALESLYMHSNTKSKGLNPTGDTTFKTQSYPNSIMTKRQLM